MNEHNENDKLRVLLLKPGELAEIAEIEDNLESMQRLVEGNIEEYMPFEDASDPRIGDCAIVCNEEGKMLGMELNRGIFDQNGRLQDIIAGPFLFATHLSKAKDSCPCRLIWKKKCGRNSSFRSSFMSRKTESGRKRCIP